MSRIYKEYDLLLQIGAGTYSAVYKAKRKSDGLLVAIKIVESQSENEVSLIVSEANVLKHLMGGPPSIPKIYDFFNEGPLFFIIMEYLDGYITLLEWANSYSSLIFNGTNCDEDLQGFVKAREEDIIYIFGQIVSSINYLHQKFVIHRDLKLENIMFNPKTREIKLIDFGFSIISQTMVWTTICGSFEYLAPEVLHDLINQSNEKSQVEKDPEYTTQTEVWSLGIILYGMIYCRLPFFHQNRLKLIKLVLNSEISYDPEKAIFNPSLNILLHSMLQKDPTQRLNFTQVYQYPLFTETYKQIIKSTSYKAGIHRMTYNSDNTNKLKPIPELNSRYTNNYAPNLDNKPNESNKDDHEVGLEQNNNSNVTLSKAHFPLTYRMSYTQKSRNFAKINKAFPLRAKIVAPKLVTS
ncbi:serine/threonine protein kinase [Tritrichomonas musculus]|uniref:Serine/threonine protein kinase n=1 Tax=Tritrichomonas musculus TaxID=1915356 RepID=A0ABR2JET9_9EUKA